MRKAALGVLLALGLALTSTGCGRPDKPNCPTEDSCRPEYHDGEWTIVEVTP